MSYFTNENVLYSHPNKRLETHLLNVAKLSKQTIESMCIEDKNLYANLSFLIGLTHDFAKSTSYFQDHLLNETKTTKAYHGFLSAIFGYYVINQYIENNKITTKINYSLLAYLAIRRHHGNLLGLNEEFKLYSKNLKTLKPQINDIKTRNITHFKEFYQNYSISIDDFLKTYNKITKKLNNDLLKMTTKADLNNYSTLLLLYSVLIDSDKLDASETNPFKRPDINSDIVDKYKKEEFTTDDPINQIRNIAYNELTKKVEDINLRKKIYSINLPTGSGKTLDALSFALKLRDKINRELKFKPRIIYSLPFLSIIDQNEVVFKEVLKKSSYEGTDILLKHNSLSDIYYKTSKNEELTTDKSEMLIEGWYSEIVITTFIQFFYTLITNKNRSLRKYHNMTNSIIILDEIQAIPYKYWSIVNTLLKEFAEKNNTWVILMTATQPLIFKEPEEITPLIKDKNIYFDKFDRIQYNFYNEDITLDDFKEKIITEIEENPEKDIMIVLNTINSSKEIYDYIKEYAEEINLNNELYYLSTNIIPKHRLEKIKQIRKSSKSKIIVTTQLIEAGVDIDVDIIYRDFAPLDSIIQTAGRCNRNNKKEKGIVNIINLTNEKGKKYSSFIYSSMLMEITKELIKDKNNISEKEFNKIMPEKYYQEVQKRGTKDESEKLLKKIEKLEITDIQRDFKLITENIKKIDIFVQIDENAIAVWNKYIEIKENKEYTPKKRNTEFKKIKSNFYQYVVSIDEKQIGTSEILDENILYLDQEDIQRKYDKETGFIPQKDEEAFII